MIPGDPPEASDGDRGGASLDRGVTPLRSVDPPDPLRRRLAGGGAWAFSGRIFVAIATLAITTLAARLLTDSADSDTFFLVTSLMLGIGIVGQFGLHRVVVRMVAESLAIEAPGRTRRVIDIILKLSFAISATIAVVFAIGPVQNLLGNLFPTTRIADVAFLLGLAIALRSMSLVHAETFRGFQEIGKATFFGGVDAQLLFVVVLGALWFFAREQATLHSILALNAAVWVPGLIVSGYMLMRRAARLEGAGDATTREVLTIAVPILVQGVGQLLISQADLWIVGARLSAGDPSRYGAALRLFAVIGIPLQIVNSVVPPMIVELKAKGQVQRLQRMLRSTATAATVPALAVVLLFVGFGSQVMGIVYGDFYRGAGSVLAILGISNLVSALTGSCGIALMMTGHERVLMYITSACAVLLVVGSFIGTRWGITGVAVASTIAFSTQNIAAWIAARRLIGVYTHAGIAPGIDGLRTVVNR